MYLFYRMSANLRIYLPSGEHRVVRVTPTTTLGEIVAHVQFKWTNKYVIMNQGHTHMSNYEMTMSDYNNWYVEGGFIPSLFIVDPNSE